MAAGWLAGYIPRVVNLNQVPRGSSYVLRIKKEMGKCDFGRGDGEERSDEACALG